MIAVIRKAMSAKFAGLDIDKKIGVSVFSGITVVSFFLIVYFTVSFSIGINREFKERIVSLGENLANITAGPLYTSLSFGEDFTPETLAIFENPLASVIKSKDISYAFLLYKGNIIARANRFNKDDSQYFPGKATGKRFGKYSVLKTTVGDRRFLELRIPVTRENEALGEIALGFSNATITSTILFSMFLSLILGALTTLIVSKLSVSIINRSVVAPVKYLISVAKDISDGNLSQKEIAVQSMDEIGQLGDAFNKMLSSFNKLVERADLIVKGTVGADAVEKKMTQGIDFMSASESDNKSQGDLAIAFDSMQTALRKTTIQARLIAHDELYNSILDVKLPGELGEAFQLMISNLRGLAKSAEQIAAGNLAITLQSHSEKDTLVNVFIKMTHNLRELVLEVDREINSIVSSSSLLAQSCGKSTQTISQLENSINQISTTVMQVAQNSQVASTDAAKVDTLARDGKKTVETTLIKMKTIESAIESAEASMNDLSRHSAQIGEIINVITKISDQTNLLSLNAAIEAARVGDAGKGFAVVADEVRKLAETSAKEADEIAKIINLVLSGTKKTLGIVNSASNAAKEGSIIIGQSNKIFFDIAAAVENLSRQIEQMAASIEETAASVSEVTSSSKAQTAAMGEISSSAAKLADIAKILKSAISGFKTS